MKLLDVRPGMVFVTSFPNREDDFKLIDIVIACVMDGLRPATFTVTVLRTSLTRPSQVYSMSGRNFEAAFIDEYWTQLA